MYLSTELFDLRRRFGSFGWLGETRARRAGIGDVDPDEIVLLFAGIAAGIDAIDFQRLIGSERRDQLALAVVHVELPAVIAALEIFSVEFSAVERHAAMRAGVAQGERLSLAIASDDERNFQQRRLVKLIAMNAIGGQRAIPEAGEHQSIGGLALREVEFGHGDGCC